MTAKPTIKELLEHRIFTKLQLYSELPERIVAKEEISIQRIEKILFDLLEVKLGARNKEYLSQFCNPDYIQKQTKNKTDVEVYNNIIQMKDSKEKSFVGNLMAISRNKPKKVSKKEFDRQFGFLLKQNENEKEKE
jgi:hypothetical protein